MNKAIFIDKDGTLIPDIPFNINPGLITLHKESTKGLVSLHDAGYLFIIITNQGGIAKGYFSVEDLDFVKSRISELLDNLRIPLSGFYYCPHDTNGNVEGFKIGCYCRKPLPGMLIEAASDHFIDLNQSWMIGDILNDVEAGNRAGCKTVLIDNGGETEWLPGMYREPDFKARNINEAAVQILNYNYERELDGM